MEKIVDTFKALSDPTRLKIMWLLSKANSELCVCEIVDSSGECQCNISRHLKILKNAGLVHYRKKGKWATYGIIDPDSQFLKHTLQAVLTFPAEELALDRERLEKRLSFRENGRCVLGMNSHKWQAALKELHKNDIDQKGKGGQGHVG